MTKSISLLAEKAAAYVQQQRYKMSKQGCFLCAGRCQTSARSMPRKAPAL